MRATKRIESAPPLALVTSRRTVEREHYLEWYWTDGLTLFEGSSFGAVIERQALYGQTTGPCGRCSGSGVTEGGAWCRGCGGSGSERPKRLGGGRTARRGHLLFGTVRCGACSGVTGRTECPACHGEGAVLTLPVGQASGDHEEPPSYAPDVVSLTRYAQVSRWLRSLLPRDVAILRAYYGPDGYRWGSTRWGRLMSVVVEIPAGRELLAAEPNPLGLGAHMLLANCLDRIDRISDRSVRAELRERIATVTRAAAAEYRLACAAWNVAVNRSPSKK